jgi:two-component system, OmpR family, response regulator MprA
VIDGHDRPPRVLIVEDDEDIAQVLQRSLRLEGYETRIAADGQLALDQAADFVPDLVVLDLGLPKIDGIEVARRLRSADDVPILMLTARDAVEARVAGLDSGADDYLVKPFDRQELLARLRALLRRRTPDELGAGTGPGKQLEFADLTLDPDTRDVRRGDRPISLTRTEFSLLELLLTNPRRVLTRSQILEQVWGYDFPTTGNALEVYIGYLRRKTEAEGETRLIHTVRGVGYVLRDTPP